jgi:hypothetical protein
MEGNNFQNTGEGANPFPKEEDKEEVCEECGKKGEECDCEECECEGEECHCEDEEEMPDELDTEEVAVEAYNRLDALVEILIKKGIITEEELDDMEDKLLEDDEEEGAAS